MRILLISTAFNGLTQRFYTELHDAGYEVSVELHHGDDEKLIEGIELFKPDLILCPFLTRRIPEIVYKKYLCIIVHPGIKGDRGPSSLDWAIQSGASEWGVTLLQADDEMDAGDIWSSKTFPMREATKSSLYNREVTETAIKCLWEVVTFAEVGFFKPEPLDYSRADVKGCLLPLMKQSDRQIDWQSQSTEEILRIIRAADGNPGVLDEIHGKKVFLYNAHKETVLTGQPGEIIAIANKSVCRATVDGAVWIGHLKPKYDSGENGVKLRASVVLEDVLPDDIQKLEIDYTLPGRQFTCQEVWYEIEDDVAYLHSSFHNGAMNTEQCQILLHVYQYIASLSVKAIVLLGGADFWSNGIHLNTIETAECPKEESWSNINAINDIVHQIIVTMDKLTISAIAGNAGAGGVILALASDLVLARKGVILNPHYKTMGNLYGSEYWTYLLPKRVGDQKAVELTSECMALSASKAHELGMVDKVLDNKHGLFYEQVKNTVKMYIAECDGLKKHLEEKAQMRCEDEARCSLALYRKNELKEMYHNFYGEDDSYHQARHRFVYKKSCNVTPENIAKHRRWERVSDISEIQSVKKMAGSCTGS